MPNYPCTQVVLPRILWYPLKPPGRLGSWSFPPRKTYNAWIIAVKPHVEKVCCQSKITLHSSANTNIKLENCSATEIPWRQASAAKVLRTRRTALSAALASNSSAGPAGQANFFCLRKQKQSIFNHRWPSIRVTVRTNLDISWVHFTPRMHRTDAHQNNKNAGTQ